MHEEYKKCQFCDAVIIRPRWSNGKLEAKSLYLKRKYCNRSCYKNAVIAENNCTPKSARKRAQRKYKLTKCQTCSTQNGLTRHHRDGNTYNNLDSNIMILCYQCHADQHTRDGIPWGRVKVKKHAGT